MNMVKIPIKIDPLDGPEAPSVGWTVVVGEGVIFSVDIVVIVVFLVVGVFYKYWPDNTHIFQTDKLI